MFDGGKATEALMIARQANEAAAAASSAAQKASVEIAQHSAVCAERQRGIDNKLGEMAKSLGDVRAFLGRAMWGLLVGLLMIVGFAVEQISVNEHWFGK